MPPCTRLQASANTQTKWVHTHTKRIHCEQMNKQRGTALVYRRRHMRAAYASSSKEGLKEHAATPPPRPGLSLLLPPAPNYQYMFKGHPLTFDSHRPLCDLLLSAKGFEEHSNWSVSEGGGRQRGDREGQETVKGGEVIAIM